MQVRNEGDKLILSDNNGVLVKEFAFGGWYDGSKLCTFDEVVGLIVETFRPELIQPVEKGNSDSIQIEHIDKIMSIVKQSRDMK